jgi:hypothetical protein
VTSLMVSSTSLPVEARKMEYGDICSFTCCEF